MSAERDAVIEAIYRALVEYDRELRGVRTLRSILGRGPTIKRGTKRAALAVYLADVVLAQRAKWQRWEAEAEPGDNAVVVREAAE